MLALGRLPGTGGASRPRIRHPVGAVDTAAPDAVNAWPGHASCQDLTAFLPALASSGAPQVVSPFKDGILQDWEAAEGLLEHALK